MPAPSGVEPSGRHLEHLSPAQAASRVPEIERSIAQGGCYNAKSLASTPKGTTRRGGDLGQTEELLPEMSAAKRAQSRHDKTGPNWAGFALGYLRGMMWFYRLPGTPRGGTRAVETAPERPRYAPPRNPPSRVAEFRSSPGIPLGTRSGKSAQADLVAAGPKGAVSTARALASVRHNL